MIIYKPGKAVETEVRVTCGACGCEFGYKLSEIPEAAKEFPCPQRGCSQEHVPKR